MMSDSWAEGLATQLQEDAVVLRRWGQTDLADALNNLGTTIKERIAEWQLEELTLDQAAAESGFSESHLRRLVHENRIQNVGGNRRLRVRRGDLPRKAGGSSPRAASQEPDLAAQVLRARGLEIP